jgi:Tfp pilus assembly protein PilF
LALMLGLSASLGCMNGQYSMPTMMVPPQPSAAAPPVGELSSAQAAQLCLTAGESLEMKGFPAEAIRQYENARQHDAGLRSISRRLAVLYDLQGDTRRAETEYQRALREQSSDAELLNDFGYFHYRHDRMQAAETWLRNAITVNPDYTPAWINLGQVLARQGHVEESYQSFAHVLRPAEAYSNLGVLLAKQGRTNEARRALQQAVTLDPTLEQPRAFLKALPSSTGVLPANLAYQATRSAAFTPAARDARPRAPLDAPPPLRHLPSPSLDLPRSRIDTSSSRRVLPPVLPPPAGIPSVGAAAPSGSPIIVNGPIGFAPARPMPMPTAPRPLSAAPPPPPPSPQPLLPVGRGVGMLGDADAPILLRTSASFAQTNALGSTSAADEPQPLPLPARSSPLLPVSPPQATLIDCQGEEQTESGPR